MTGSPAESNKGRFYTRRVGYSLHKYAREQEEDIRDGLSETARLYGKWYESARDGNSESELLRDWVELWAATMHYSSAMLANLGGLISGLGYELKKSRGDSLRPHRTLEVDGDVMVKPRCLRWWRIGEGDVLQTQLSPARVDIRQAQGQAGGRVWDVYFDLGGPTPGEPKHGMYCVEFDVGGNLKPEIRYFHLDPQPASP